MLASKLLSACGGEEKLWVDDLFAAHTYTGTGSTQTINNGIDLAGKGGLVWVKVRNSADAHYLCDTARGARNGLSTNSTAAQVSPTAGRQLTSFDATGFTLGTDNDFVTNENGRSFISWTLRKAPKFFDVVTFTAAVGVDTTVAHSLGATPGMVVIKRTDSTGDWRTWHKDLTAGYSLDLHTTNAQTNRFETWLSATASNITLSDSAVADGASYVAYLFAHDTSADGLIQCGSYEATGATNTIELGWEPQFMLWRPANQAEHWRILDTSRGWVNGGNDANLYANASSAEASNELGYLTATGVSISNIYTSGTYIYLAIRRPNKPPTTGTQVYNAVARTGTGSGSVEVTGAGFAPDMVVGMGRGSAFGTAWYDRLRGKELALRSALTNAEYSASPGGEGTLSMDGVKVETSSGILNSAGTYINWFFKRAPGFFDVACYTGTGASRTVPHSLGVAPELLIVKSRSVAGATRWCVYAAPIGATKYLALNQTLAENTSAIYWNNTAPTDSVFTVTSDTDVNSSGQTYVAYLFASLPGISKVGSYTGNGSSQTINCGFSSGARFVLTKRTDSTGDWFVWDTARGIVSANDPHLSLNTTAAEVTTNDSVDPDSTGFVVNQVAATNINVNAATFLYLAIA